MGHAEPHTPKRRRTPNGDADGLAAREYAVRFLIGLVLLYALVALLARAFADPLRALGREIVERVGLPGFALGAFLADGFHFPVPPQFYMLLTVALDLPVGVALLSISMGSLLGGAVEFGAARVARRSRWLERPLQRLGAERFIARAERHPYRWVFIGSLTPISHSWLCFLVGLARLPRRAFWLLCLLRIPKLLLYFVIVQAGWSGTLEREQTSWADRAAGVPRSGRHVAVAARETSAASGASRWHDPRLRQLPERVQDREQRHERSPHVGAAQHQQHLQEAGGPPEPHCNSG